MTELITRILLLPLLWAATACVSVSGADDTVDRVDQEFRGPPLKSLHPQILGELTQDGEGHCENLPYSACGYKYGRYHYYFHEGMLVSKKFEFDLSGNNKGPLGLGTSDSIESTIRKVERIVNHPIKCVDGGSQPVCYALLNSDVRIDFHFNDHKYLQAVRLYVTDFV